MSGPRDGVEVDVSPLLTTDTAADLPREPTEQEAATVRAMFGPTARAVCLPGRLAVIMGGGQ